MKNFFTGRKSFSGSLALDALSSFFLILPYAVLFSLFIAVPVAMAIGLSFTVFDAVQPPSFVGMLNYITLLTQDEVFMRYVLPNTFRYAIIVGPGGYLLSFVLAWILAQIQKGPRTIFA